MNAHISDTQVDTISDFAPTFAPQHVHPVAIVRDALGHLLPGTEVLVATDDGELNSALIFEHCPTHCGHNECNAYSIVPMGYAYSEHMPIVIMVSDSYLIEYDRPVVEMEGVADAIVVRALALDNDIRRLLDGSATD